MRNRALVFIKQLLQRHVGKDILLVTHNGWMRQVISHLAGVSIKDISRVGNAQVIEIEVNNDLTGKVKEYPAPNIIS